MAGRITFVVLAILTCCGICEGADQRWNNFAEDSDLKYYLDRKSVVPLPDNIYLFWIKSVAKDSDYFQAEYNLAKISYVLTNYEMDCAVSRYRVRSTVMVDKNRRELSKIVPVAGEVTFEPVQPETMLELAQEEICSGNEKTGGVSQAAAPPVPAPQPADDALATPEPGNPFEPALPPAEPEQRRAPATAARQALPAAPPETATPQLPAAANETAAPEAPLSIGGQQ
ncbi:hypothetical protein [Geomonas sp.]|uniref:hypothetical protein n=1 Tax=Geomonas sp. TaxID=2651584 RepID=UPI002B485537|nr:hypothetical protein [Geomonas sp.]HJV34247.1 hypothetical protein [Geomonas sp.]